MRMDEDRQNTLVNMLSTMRGPVELTPVCNTIVVSAFDPNFTGAAFVVEDAGIRPMTQEDIQNELG